MARFMTSLRQIQTTDMRNQPLDLCDDGADAAEFAPHMFARGLVVGRPDIGDEARAGTDAKRRETTHCDGLTDEAKLRRDLRPPGLVGGDAISQIPAKRA